MNPRPTAYEAAELPLLYPAVWWERMDLNHRSPKAPDLQSGVIDHSTTLPYGDAGEPRTPKFRLERAVTLPIRPQHRGTPNETRTRITGLRGQPPIPIRGWEYMAPPAGLEPATSALTVRRSTN